MVVGLGEGEVAHEWGEVGEQAEGGVFGVEVGLEGGLRRINGKKVREWFEFVWVFRRKMRHCFF